MPRQSLLDAALAWAGAGFFVFPCAPDAKTPATANGHLAATTDAEQIRAWWSANPNYNIGVVPGRSGMAVLDIDPPLGAASLARLEVTNGPLPATMTIRTPRGGLHYWFEADWPPTASKLGDKIDTRGRSSYVLVPPSIVKGNPYVLEANHNIAVGPQWIEQSCARADSHVSASDVDLDQPGNIARARSLLTGYVASGHVAVEGNGGDNRTYAVCCEVLNLGLSADKALELIDEIWNPHCQPAWERSELEAKVLNASEYAQNDVGAWAVAPAEDVFQEFAKSLPSQTSVRSRFHPLTETEQDALADPTWLLPNLIPDEAIVLMYGPSGEYKSFLALDMALHLAANTEGYGRTVDGSTVTPVVYIAAEGARAIVRKRRPAWRIAHGIDKALPFYAIDAMPLVARGDEVIELIQAIKARSIAPRLVIVDTLARALAGLNENDAKDAGILVEAVECIKRAFGCSVLVLHHTGKEEAKGARGSSALFAGFDTVLSVSAHKQSKCVELRVRKQKDADEAEDPWFYQGQMVGPSLVFHNISRDEYKSATAEDDQFARAKVGALLRRLGAVGQEHGVPTRVLATEFIEGHASDDALAPIVKKLNRLAKDRLEAYQVDGLWFLPASE